MRAKLLQTSQLTQPPNKLQGLQAQRVLFDFQFTGSKLFTFLYVMMNFNSPLKHNFTQINVSNV